MGEIKVADKDTLDKIARAVGVKDDNKIYGIKINKYDSNPDTRCTYLGDAVGMTPAKMNFETGEFDYGDWADAWFVRDNFPCMLDSTGNILYKLDPNDYSLREDGTANDSSEYAMSAIPTVWIWQYELGDYKYIYLANYKVNDNYKAYAHQRADDSIAPYVFMSIYRGSITSFMGTDALTSQSGLPITYGKYTVLEEFDLIALQLSDLIWNKKTWFQRNLMICMITMILCSTNSSAKLGKGLSTAHDSTAVTGTLDKMGQFYGYNDTDHHMKAFHQEDVWGSVWDRIDGIRLTNGQLKIGYKYVIDMPRAHNKSGWFHNTLMTEFGDFPIDIDGSSATYECSRALLGMNSGEKYPVVGGAYDDGGSLHNYCDNTSYNYKTRAGVSLSCLPL